MSAATEAHFRLIEKRNRMRLEREQLPGFEPTATAPPPAAPGDGGVKGKRKSKKDKAREAAGLSVPSAAPKENVTEFVSPWRRSSKKS